MGNPDKQPSDAAQSPAHPLMENSVADHPLLQMEAVRKECMALRTQFATENARLEAVSSSALAEVAQQRKEIAQQHDEITRLKASSRCENAQLEAVASSALAEVAQQREEIAQQHDEITRLKASGSCENARLEAISSSAVAEVAQLREEIAQQHDEITRLKASSCCESCGGQGLTGSLSSATSEFLEAASRNQEAMRIALLQERQQNAKLALEKGAIEEKHRCDIESLERVSQLNAHLKSLAVLQEVTTESVHSNSSAETTLPAISEEKQGSKDMVKNIEAASSDAALKPTEVLDEPEMEPRRESLEPQDRLSSTLNNFSYNFLRDIERSFAEIS